MFQISTVYAPTVFLKLVLFLAHDDELLYISNWIYWIKILYQLLILSILFLSSGFFFFLLILSVAFFFLSFSPLPLLLFFSLLEKEIEREVLEVESREKKSRIWDIWVYICGVEKTKRKKKKNIWMKEWKYYYNIFTIFSQ